MQHFLPRRLQAEKAIGHGRVGALCRAVDQALRHPGEAPQPGVGLLGLEQLTDDVPALGLKHSRARQARRDVLGDLMRRQRCEDHQPRRCRVMLLHIAQRLADGQGRLAPPQRELPAALVQRLGPRLTGFRPNRQGHGRRIARQHPLELRRDLRSRQAHSFVPLRSSRQLRVSSRSRSRAMRAFRSSSSATAAAPVR